MALTEPQAGSSLADVATTATPTADGHYLIRGTKIFISGGDHDLTDNVVHLALARIDGAPPASRACRCSASRGARRGRRAGRQRRRGHRRDPQDRLEGLPSLIAQRSASAATAAAGWSASRTRASATCSR
jgi:hypothetical protein